MRSELSQPIKRFIKRKEESLGRTCRTIWTHTNPNNEHFMYGSFCNNYHKVIVTIAHYNDKISAWITSR
jgi:hypothetical protein